jgi:light-regulated signal transduction histidine kinase (bacteriophytochrome)
MAYVVALSLVLQLMAAALAMRLARRTERRVAWSLITAALVLMVFRRALPLYHVLAGDPSVVLDPYQESIGLALSFLMVVGIAAIAPLSTAVKRAEEVHKLNAELEQRVLDRTARLDAANKELAFQNEEKGKRAAELVIANKELEAFSYSVSHDLRAPLRHVQSYVDMLAHETESRLSDKGRHYMKTIADASREMGALIDDLLAFSRMGRAEMCETSVDLNTLVQDTLRDLEATTSARNIVWRIAPLPAVHADPAMLRLALTNLLSNAVKFTRPRDPAQIEIGSSGTADGRVTLFVRDNGVGFDPQYAHKLFGVFQRLHRADEFEGTGIGLANVQRIIARHGGRTWAEGKLNEGATFYLTLKAS